MPVMKHSVANDPSQQAVKLTPVGPRFFEHCCVGLYCFWETSGNEKWGKLGKWLCNG